MIVDNKFLKVTKIQFTAVLAVVVLTITVLQGFLLYKGYEIARDGRQSHAALCVYKQDLIGRVDRSKKFLALTPEERTARYGKAFASIPNASLIITLKNEQQTVQSLNDLHCS